MRAPSMFVAATLGGLLLLLSPRSGWADTLLCTDGSGDRWSSATGVPNVRLNAVATVGSETWFVGDRGTILHFDGQAVRAQASGTVRDLADVWGSDPRNVWAVGAGIVLHWNGQAWAQVPWSTLPIQMNGVWGSSPNDVWIVGEDGSRFHYDGNEWLYVHVDGSSAGLDDVWGTGPQDVWAAGSGVIEHFDGATWTEVTQLNSGDVEMAVWGRSATEVYAVAGYEVYSFDGSSWSSLAGAPTAQVHTSISGAGPELWVTSLGARVHQRVGSAWTEHVLPIDNGLAVLDVLADGSRVWAVGAAGLIARWDNSRWTLLRYQAHDLLGISGAARDDVWAVGAAGTVLHYDGQQWSDQSHGIGAMLSPFGGSPGNLYGVAAIGGRQVWVSEEYGQTARWSGTNWVSGPIEGHITFATGERDVWLLDSELEAVLQWDGTTAHERATYWEGGLGGHQVWASGPSHAWMTHEAQVASWDGAALQNHDLGGAVLAVWGAQPNWAWAVRDDGAILQWDGGQWQSIFHAPVGARDVWADGPNNIWVVGGDDAPAGQRGMLLHWDGTLWRRHAFSGMPMSFRSVWGAGDEIYVLGDDGAVYRAAVRY